MSYYGNNNNNNNYNNSNNDHYRRSSRDRSRSRERSSSYYGRSNRSSNNNDESYRRSSRGGYDDPSSNSNNGNYYGNGGDNRSSRDNNNNNNYSYYGNSSNHTNMSGTNAANDNHHHRSNSNGHRDRGRGGDRYDQDRGGYNANSGGYGNSRSYSNDDRYSSGRDSSKYKREEPSNNYYGRRENSGNAPNYYGSSGGGGGGGYGRDDQYSNRYGDSSNQSYNSGDNRHNHNRYSQGPPPGNNPHHHRHPQEEPAFKGPPQQDDRRPQNVESSNHQGYRPPYNNAPRSNNHNYSSFKNERANNSYNPKTEEAMSNCIVGDLTTNFHFFMYGVDCIDTKGSTIDSRRIRQELFFKGLEKHCANLKMSEKEVTNLHRALFFEGPFFFGARAIPGISNPKSFVFYNDPKIGQFIITKMIVYGRPECLSYDKVDVDPKMEDEEEQDHNNDTTNTSGKIPKKKREDKKPLSSRSMLLADYRCNDCCSAFTTSNAIIVHCQSTGHKPIYADDLKNIETPKKDLFLSYCNVALQRALGERMVRWGCEYIDPKTFTEPKDKQNRPLGLKLFRAFSCDFNCMNVQTGEDLDVIHSNNGDDDPNKKPTVSSLVLTVDLRAKLIRTQHLLSLWCENTNPNHMHYDENLRRQINEKWLNEQIICTYDKKTYGIVEILFDESPASMLIPTLGISHAEYFQRNKGIQLQFPTAKPMIKTLGRNKVPIFLPAELVCGNEIDSKARSILPLVASFAPKERNDAINEMKRYLTPGAQKTKGFGGGFLPALGIILREERLKVNMRHLSLPSIIAAGLSHTIPAQKKNNWLACLRDAQFSVSPHESVVLNVIVVYNHRLNRSYMSVYSKIERLVNNYRSKYRFPQQPYAAIEAGDIQDHWEAVEQYFKYNQNKLPPNIFVLDFTKPPQRSSIDQAYKVVKQMLGRAGYLSQFVNFNSADHTDSRQARRSNSILNGVSRQILNKCGLRIWWIDLPKTIPLPAIFVGADVFHAQRKFDPVTGKMAARSSCAAAVIQLVRQVDGPKGKMSTIELYSTTRPRTAGKEMELGSFLKDAITEALHHFKVSPMSCIVWRDGVGVGSLNTVIQDEVQNVRHALGNMSISQNGAPPRPVDLAYVVCQKEISTKFISSDGNCGMQSGALIEGLNLSDHDTFYINGNAPQFSTPRAVRFVVVQKDEGLQAIQVPELAWALCHDYPNWTGPIKVPSLVQMAHKLAELAGNYEDCGESMNNTRFANTMHFL